MERKEHEVLLKESALLLNELNEGFFKDRKEEKKNTELDTFIKTYQWKKYKFEEEVCEDLEEEEKTKEENLKETNETFLEKKVPVIIETKTEIEIKKEKKMISKSFFDEEAINEETDEDEDYEMKDCFENDGFIVNEQQNINMEEMTQIKQEIEMEEDSQRLEELKLKLLGKKQKIKQKEKTEIVFSGKIDDKLFASEESDIEDKEGLICLVEKEERKEGSSEIVIETNQENTDVFEEIRIQMK